MTRPELTLVPTTPPPLSARADDDLMLLASAGRRDAFATLVERYAARLTNVCVKLTCDVRAGEELAQDCWLALWQARTRYRPDGRFAAYLYTMARNRCRNHLRQRASDRARAAAAAPADAVEPEHVERLLEAERRRRVLAAMATLSPTMREALVLRFVEGLDYPTIAARVGRTESAVRSRVHEAVLKLRHELSRSQEP